MTRPLRRTCDLIVRESGDEILVLDERTGSVHCLPAELAGVWRSLCSPDPRYDVAALAELDALGLLEPGFDRRRFLTRAGLVGVGTLAAATVMTPAAFAAGSTTASNAATSNLIGLYQSGGAGPGFGAWTLYSGAGISLGDPLGAAVMNGSVKSSASSIDPQTQVNLDTTKPTTLNLVSDPSGPRPSVGAIFSLPNTGNAATLALTFACSSAADPPTVFVGDKAGPMVMPATPNPTTFTTTYSSSGTTQLVVGVFSGSGGTPVTVAFTQLTVTN